MLPGFNTDVKHQGATYHVQTEDNGEANPIIISLVYAGGAILARLSTSYKELIGTPTLKKEVAVLMKEQHRKALRAVMEGNLEGLHAEATPAAASPPPAASPMPLEPASLDEAIMRFIAASED